MWPPSNDAEVEAALLRVANSNQWVEGPQTEALEAELADYSGAKHTAAVANGTMAIQAALAGFGIGRNSGVLVPAYTFTGSVLPIVNLGANPIFVDVDPDTFNVTRTSVAQALRFAEQFGFEVSAAVIVDLFGLVVDDDVFELLADEPIAVLEDACQAVGAAKVGNRADATVYSFNHTKPLAGGEGGAVVTDNPDIDLAVRRWRRFGEYPFDTAGRTYETVGTGTNAKISEFAAAATRVALTRLDDHNAHARRAGAYLSERLDGLVSTPKIPEGADHVFHKYRVYGKGFDDPALAAPRTRWVERPVAYHSMFDAYRYGNEYIGALAVANHSWCLGSEPYPLWTVTDEVLDLWISDVAAYHNTGPWYGFAPNGMETNR